MSTVSTDPRRSFDAWAAPHLPIMRQLAVRLAGPSAADDCVQDALLRAWNRRADFEAKRGSARSWLLAIVADQARQRGRRPERPVTSLTVVSAGGGEWGEPLAAAADAADLDLRAAVEQLPERQRLAVECHYYLGLKTRETARVMDAAPGTVSSTLAAARESLRKILGEDHR